MNKIYLLFVCCFISLAASAVGTTYYPISISAPYAGSGQTICQNGTNTATVVTYSVCGTSIPAGGTLSVTAQWYLNGVPVYLDLTPHNITGTTGTISLAAGKIIFGTFGSFTGAKGLYCALSWVSSPSPCTGLDSAAGTPTNITVNESPVAISGAASVCSGNTTTLSDAVTGGIWSSSNTAIGSINFSTGSVLGVAAGTVHISYTLGSGCYVTSIFTVNQTPAAITGLFSLCGGSNGSSGTLTTLHDATAGGTWTSSVDTVATIGSTTGSLTALPDSGVAIGVTTISYTMPSGCMTVTNVTVNESPSIITGPGTVCSGSTITLMDSVSGSGAVWTSSNSSVASVNFSTGVVTGTGASGVARISYTLNSGCYSSVLVTVNPKPAAILGIASVCVNSLTSLSDPTIGGTWSTSNSSAEAGTGSGFVLSGVTAGLDTIIYVLNTGCSNSRILTINPLPANINGTDSVCAGSTTALTDVAAGGTWSSSIISVATVNASGVVTGVASGVTIITYKLSTGCYIDTAMKVNALPAAISGPTSVCVGSIITLSDAVSGGVWSSSNTFVAFIGSNSGITGGESSGTSIISYTLATGCAKSITLTVNATPATISGSPSVCVGTTTTLSDVTIGGVWSSSTTSVATISPSGVVSGLSAGTTTISYKVSSGCTTEFVVTVNSNPSPISGIAHVCLGATTALSDLSTGGTWTSSNPAIGSVDVFGNVTGVVAGTVMISYTIATGCLAITPVTINPLPVAISGANNICAGSTMTLSDATAGGTWSSTNTGLATVSAGGIVVGLIPGSDTINYTITTTGCVAIQPITINPIPATISGSPVVCIGLITSLTDATSGGIWSSSNTLKAAVDGSGNVTGIAAGTATISYALSTGCLTKTNVTINALPASISGLNTVCDSATITLSDATLGGAWSTSDPTIATVSGTGVVTGTGPGVVNIIYTLGTGCITTTQITVNSLPSVITGTESVCAGLTSTLTDGVSGGIWSSSNTSVATIGFNTGLVTAIATGTSKITYTLSTGCKEITIVTVMPLPAVISGPTNVCMGSIITLSDVTSGGTWASTDITIATIGAGTGIVTGISAGTSMMTYTLSTGCIRTVNVNVNPLPGGITGASSVCIGATTALSDPTPGGTWSSNTTSVATAAISSGVITGVTAGTAVITYSLSTGCDTTVTMTVNPLPANITGPTSVCQGQTITLGDGAFVGTWSSSNTTVGTIDMTSGILTGVAAGTTTVTFALNSTGCYKTITVTVHQLPPSITGNTVMCVSTPSGLADLTTGGTWSSSNIGVAIINTSGLVNPQSTGTSTITYTLPTGCYNTTTITVNPNPSVISGSAAVCVGSTTTLSDATLGGTWVSSNSTIATVVDTTGVVTGILAGPVTINYVLSTGCTASLSFSVNPLPAAITGTTYLCRGTTTVLHDVTPGGTWSSSDISIATTGTPGAVIGVNAGTAIISYIPATGCIATIIVTVNSDPGPINGRLYICTVDTTMLTDTVSGGQWTSSNPSVAAAGALSGIVTGIAAGSATITYSLGTGCYTTNLVTVYTTPASITGPVNVCQGFSITLSDATPGGIWYSSDTSVATAGYATGIIVGDTSIIGPDTISYTTGGHCSAYKVINVNPTPSRIRGISDVCTGYSNVLSDNIAGGTWTSTNNAIATVGLSSGTVTGISGGIVNISYILGTGCYTFTPDTVNVTPTVIMGATNVCPGLTITLSDGTAGGTWTSSASSVAVVGIASGVVTGVNEGSAVISYIVGTGCGVASVINVNPAPPTITGPLNMCAGLTSALTDAASGGIWISSNTAIAPVGDTSGVVSGIQTGTANITYELLSSGCITVSTVTVNPLPGPILGFPNVCTDATITLSDTTTTVLGSWSSSNTPVATVGALTGIVSGIDSGYATITYTLLSGCYSTYLIRVNQTPNAIMGSNSVCPGVITSLSDPTPFGTWSSSDTSVIAVIDLFTGNVTGIVPGTTNITYMLGTGCYTTQEITVNPLPAPIIGSSIVCVGATMFMGDSTSGGVWSSTNTAIGSVDVSGDVTGIAPGNYTIVYTLATGCLATHFITVSAVSSPIVGDSIVCVGSVDSLTSTPPGGAWSSHNVTIASVGSGTGYVTGVSAGIVLITYTTLAGCRTQFSITVNPTPDHINGIGDLCPGSTTTLFDSTGGGVWSSTNSLVATVSPSGSSATVSAILAGNTTTISYTIADGCAATLVFTVNPLPYIGSITGNTVFCMTTTTALSDSVAGGVWSSGDPAIATIGTSGIATGVAVGTATISYKVVEQCGSDSTTTVVSVRPLPYAGPIQGSPQLCIHSSTTLIDSSFGGVWQSTDTAIASVNAVTGVVYGANSGTATISYTYTNSCGSATATTLVTVNATFGFAHIVTGPDTPMCSQTFNQNFGALLPEPSGIVYNWSVSSGDSVVAVGANGQYAIINFNNSGRAVVTLSAEVISSGCYIADSVVYNVSSSVSSNPGVQYYVSQFVCTDNTEDTYQWGYDDIITMDSSAITGETSQTYYNPHPDTLNKNYWVITTKNGCLQKSYYHFNLTSSITNVNENKIDINLFPNPADEKVNIEVKGLKVSDVVELKMIDIYGKDIQAGKLVNGKGSMQISELPSGLYSVLIFNNGVKIGSKVFVKN